MAQSMAEVLREEGRLKGREEGREEGQRIEIIRSRQQMLERLVTKRFKKIPATVIARINNTTDVKLLDAWLDTVVTARTLKSMGIA